MEEKEFLKNYEEIGEITEADSMQSLIEDNEKENLKEYVLIDGILYKKKE